MNSISTYHQNILEYTHKYQKLGLEVVPTSYVKDDGACSCSKGEQCPSPGKHPAVRGWNDSYTSKGKAPEQIVREHQGLGIRTGRVNKLIVVDCDTEESYSDVLDSFDLPRTRTVRTYRGYQIYLKIPYDLILTGGTGVLDSIDIPYVDLRAENNFVMAPPSKHPNGCIYEWAIKGRVADAPEALIELLGKENSETNIAETFSGRPIRVGCRHDTFMSLATKCRGMGLNEEELKCLLLSIPYENPDDNNLSEQAISDIVEWACKNLEVKQERRELLETLLSMYLHYSERPWSGVGGGTDHDVVIALIRRGLYFGKTRDTGVDIPISRRTLASKAGTTTKTVEKSLKRLTSAGIITKGQKVEGSISSSQRLLYISVLEKIDYGDITESCGSSFQRARGVPSLWN